MGYFDSKNKYAGSDPNTYRMTAKYNDPHSSTDVDRKMAKFVVNPDLAAAMKDQLGAGGANSQEATRINAILNKLQDGVRGYFDFFLQSAEEVFDEKYQIMETLSDNYVVFGLGARPRIFSFSGTLLNSVENDWRLSFMQLFNNYFSVSKLAKLNSASNGNNQFDLIYDGMTCRGAMLSLRTSTRADNEMATSFAFSMVVTKRTTSNLQTVQTLDANNSEDQRFRNAVATVQEVKTGGVQVTPTDNSLAPINPTSSEAIEKKLQEEVSPTAPFVPTNTALPIPLS